MEIVDELTTRLAAHLDACRILGLQPCRDRRSRGLHLMAGLVDCAPFARIDASTFLSQRAQPNASRPPIVVTDLVFGESMIIADDLDQLVPIWIATTVLDKREDEWKRWDDGTATDWGALRRLHEALGGKDDLEGIRSAVGSDEMRTRLCLGEAKRMNAPLVEFIEMAAPSSRRVPFQRGAHALESSFWVEFPSDEELGVWAPTKNSLSARLHPPSGNRRPLLLAAVAHPAQHDDAWKRLHGMPPFAGDAATYTGNQLADADHLQRTAPTSLPGDEAWTRVARKMHQSKLQYDGLAHLDIVAELIDLGDAERAWNAALSAGFWIRQSKGSVPLEMIQFWRSLARDHLPDDVWPMVQANMEAIGLS